MEHVVFFPGADGAEAFSRAADLDEAVRIVERLRNENGVGDVSVFALNPVPLAFRTYVHVELSAVDETLAAPVDEPQAELVSQEPQAEVEVEVQVEQAEEPRLEAEHAEIEQAEEPQAQFQQTDETPAEFQQTEVEQVEEPQAEHVEVGEPQAEQAELFEAEQHDVEPAPAVEPTIPPPPPLPPVVDFAEVDGEWTQPRAELVEPVGSFDAFPPPPPTEVAETRELLEAQPEEPALPEPFFAESVLEPAMEAIPLSVHVEQSPSELPPLTLAPGPLLIDGEPVAALNAHHDVVEELAPAELGALVPENFSDLIPSDLVHGDLARSADEPVAEPVEALVEAPVESLVLAPVEEPQAAYEPASEAPYEAPATETLPPLDVEVPADASSLDQLPPIPAARVVEEPVAARREGPRGLGYFGG